MKKKRKHSHDNLTIDERRALMQIMIRDAVEKHGCFVMVVFGSETEPQWAYSIGIPTTFPGTSELVIFGLNPDNMGQIINNIVQLMREGQTFESGKSYDGILRGLPLYLGQVKSEHYDSHFGQAQEYHKTDTDFLVLQIIWPDMQGRFPWQDGFDEKFKDAQPLLFDMPD